MDKQTVAASQLQTAGNDISRPRDPEQERWGLYINIAYGVGGDMKLCPFMQW